MTNVPQHIIDDTAKLDYEARKRCALSSVFNKKRVVQASVARSGFDRSNTPKDLSHKQATLWSASALGAVSLKD